MPSAVADGAEEKSPTFNCAATTRLVETSRYCWLEVANAGEAFTVRVPVKVLAPVPILPSINPFSVVVSVATESRRPPSAVSAPARLINSPARLPAIVVVSVLTAS